MISFSRSGLALPLEVPDQGVRVAVGPVSEGSPEQILAGWGLSGSIRPYRRVYLMELPGECEFSRFWILKPMRIGAGRAACIARLLSHGAEWGIIPDLRWCGSDLLHRGLYQWYRGNRYLISRFLPGRTAEYQDYHDLSAALQTRGSFHVLTTRLLGKNRNIGRYCVTILPGNGEFASESSGIANSWHIEWVMTGAAVISRCGMGFMTRPKSHLRSWNSVTKRRLPSRPFAITIGPIITC